MALDLHSCSSYHFLDKSCIPPLDEPSASAWVSEEEQAARVQLERKVPKSGVQTGLPEDLESTDEHDIHLATVGFGFEGMGLARETGEGEV